MSQNNNSLLLKININIFISIRRPQKQLPILTLLTISGFVLDFEKKLRKKRFKLFNIFWTRIEMKTKKKPSYFQNVKSFFWKSFASNTNLVFLKSENSSSSDDVSDITCPFCSSNEEALLQGIGPYYEGRDSREPLYCTKGSICSRRSRATVLSCYHKSRNGRGRRKKPRPSGMTTKATSSTKKAIAAAAATLHKANAAGGIVTNVEARRHHHLVLHTGSSRGCPICPSPRLLLYDYFIASLLDRLERQRGKKGRSIILAFNGIIFSIFHTVM